MSQTQAENLSLTLTLAETRPIQVWVRTAGRVDGAGRIVTTQLQGAEAGFIKVGQRVRCFSITSRSLMQQGVVTSVSSRPGGAEVRITLANAVTETGAAYLIEIVTDRGDFLSVPNVSIIEEGGDERIVYVQSKNGQFTARPVETGVQGELYTQILSGLAEGDQVVSIGSFFIDAETKLKAGGGAMAGMDHSSMPGMDHGSMSGMDHSKMPGMAPAAPALPQPAVDHGAMPGMDHSQMPGMAPARPEPKAEKMTAEEARRPKPHAAGMRGMDHDMPGMDHSK